MSWEFGAMTFPKQAVISFPLWMINMACKQTILHLPSLKGGGTKSKGFDDGYNSVEGLVWR